MKTYIIRASYYEPTKIFCCLIRETNSSDHNDDLFPIIIAYCDTFKEAIQIANWINELK